MKLTRVVCPVCGGAVEVDEEFETAKCPYCKGSFVVEGFKHSHSKKDKEEAVYQTRTIDVEPDAVQNDLDMYSMFGWDFKHRKTHKVYDGQRYFKNGNSRDKYKDVVQITLQRNIKAKWCTDELLKADDEFFKLREEYVKEERAFENKHFFSNIKESMEQKYKVIAPLLLLAGAILFFIFIISGIHTLEGDNKGLGFVLLMLAFIALAGGIVGMILVFKKGNREAYNRQKAKEDKYKKEKDEHDDAQGKRMARMKELLAYASKQMEIKFGHGFDVQLN